MAFKDQSRPSVVSPNTSASPETLIPQTELSASRPTTLRLSITPTYDSRTTGPRYEVETRCNGKLNSTQKIADPFVRTTVKVGWGAMLFAIFRLTRAVVEVRVSADPSLMEDVLELNANYIGHGSTRRQEFRSSIESALSDFANQHTPGEDVGKA